jgi:hypothetical protein
MLQCSISGASAIVLFVITTLRRKLCFENQETERYYGIAAALWSKAATILTGRINPVQHIRRMAACIKA